MTTHDSRSANSPRTAGSIRVGTSGWHYKHWKGPFYSETLRPSEYLSYYIQRFDTVEINNSFYMQPSAESVRAWHDAVPDDFLFAFKAHRFITHMKKLKDPIDPLRRLYDVVSVLGEKIGAILFQLPPFWRVNEERLEEFLGCLSPDFRHAFEFRNPTWYTDRVLGMLEQYDQALCIFDFGGNVSPREVTANLVYVRLHGPAAGYKGSYPGETLARWRDDFEAWKRRGHDVLCYFDNDEAGHAPANASSLANMLRT